MDTTNASDMAKNLVIVESPAKAKTIKGFLGKDFEVTSCFGHIRDLPNKDIAIDVDNNFEPIYEVPKDKKKIVSELKKLSNEAETVWLASDEDREGEAISWHLLEALELDEAKTKRIVFHEITKNAILKAVENPRSINNNLVNAQQARRVLDRLVGYKISPILWKKVKPSLSAGRVQSVAVRLIVDREREIKNFVSTSSFKVTGKFTTASNAALNAELNKKPNTKEDANGFLEKIKHSKFTIGKLETKPSTKSPTAPFITSTLQQEAGRKLGFSVVQTMTLAQKLYEAGFITYMRTDSVNLSDTAINDAKDEIIKNFGSEYSNPKNYTTKSKGAQEAHEAIRPTSISRKSIDGDSGMMRLYDLIWKRTIASQMAKAQFEKTTATIDIEHVEEKFVAKGEVLKFDGFLKVYLESSDTETEEATGILPALSQGEKLTAQEIEALERFQHHPPRYTEASLVRKLEELGIGRPSTYAPTISTIQKRGYIVKEDREGTPRDIQQFILKDAVVTQQKKTENAGQERNKLFPTDIGSVVNDFLVNYFDKILDYGFTANVEKHFDAIAEGQESWNQMIKDFYSPFNEDVESTLENATKASGERVLGEHPESGKEVIARIGRFGPMIQIGRVDDEDKPQFASLLKNQSIETITLEEALDLFKLPRKLGAYEDKEVSVAIGRYGPYVRHGNSFVSINKDEGDDPYTIDLQRSIELIEQKKKEDKERVIKSFEEDDSMFILKGKWGPYLKIGRKNFRLPKDVDPAELTYEACKEISENPPKRRSKK